MPNHVPIHAADPVDDRTVRLTAPAIRQAVPVARPTSFPAPPSYRSGGTRVPTPDPTDPDDGEPADDAPKFALTSTQVIASMSAAVVAAFVGAQLGVAGTVVGAAIASVVSVVGSAVIGHSLLLTRSKVTRTVQHVRSGAGSPADAAETVLLTAVTRQIEIERSRLGGPRPVTGAGPVTRPGTGPVTRATAGPVARRTGWWSRPGRLRWMLVGLAASAAVFAAALGAVTVVEAVKGAPISGGESGFSVLGGQGDSGTRPDDDPTAVTDPVTDPTTTAQPTAASTAPSTGAPATTSTSNSPAPSTSASTSASASSAASTAASSAPATSASSTLAPAGGGTATTNPSG